MKSRLFRFMVGMLLALVHLASHAEDIDLFSDMGDRDASKLPNLLIILDNAAAFSASAATCTLADGSTGGLNGSAGGVEQCALYNVVHSLTVTETATFKVGIMVYSGANVKKSDGSACPSTGGCLVYPLTGLTTTTKGQLLTFIKSWTSNNIKSNNEATAAAMQEAWAYFRGAIGISGTDYQSIAPSAECRNFVVFIGNAVGANGTPGDNASSGDGPARSLNNTNATERKNFRPALVTPPQEVPLLGVASTSSLTVCGTFDMPSTHEKSGMYADEWAKYMKTQGISTWGIAFYGADGNSKCKPDYPWLLSSMANASEGKYYPVSDLAALREALANLFSEVRSVNSVFAAVSLPVSVNSQGTYLNQVFIGMFRPDAKALPRWNGNLKQYKMGFDTSNNFTLLDADDKLALSGSGSQFIAECARSFWTPTTADGYWTTLTDPSCTGVAAASNTPDGNIVEKGGQAYMLRKKSPAARVVKTCKTKVSDCQNSMQNFDKDAVTNSDLGVATDAARETLVNWARGTNNHPTQPESALNVTSSSMRPSAHGDVVHSRPAAVNFGDDASPKVVVFYGTNDGILRAVNGNRTATFTVSGTTIDAGQEFWSFVPPEFYGKLKRRFDNSDNIAGDSPKDYAMDGPITAYRDADGNAWLFIGMRRGGRTLYAFKVNKSDLSIELKWKVGCIGSGTSNCSSDGFADIGQTWSAPQVFSAAGYESGTKKLLVVGGGYDAVCEDALTYACTKAGQTGNHIYVIDLESGELRATFDTERPVIGDVTVVPNAEGKADLMYVGDLGGNVYRISGSSATGKISTTEPDATAPAPSEWTITRIAALGCANTDPCTSPPNRKFMFSPDIVIDGNDYYILLGSGDREKPTDRFNATNNYFFAIKDRPSVAPSSWLHDANCTAANTLCLASLAGFTPGTTPSSTDLAGKKGWYLILKANEQVVTGANAVYGTVYFATHEPVAATNSCVPNLGISRAYAVKYLNGAPARANGKTYNELADAGLSPDLVVGKVTLDNGTTVPFCIGCDGPIKPSQPTPPAVIKNPAKIRAYWYIQK